MQADRPVVPFLTEAMWRTCARRPTRRASTCATTRRRTSRSIDEQLSTDMDAVLRVISLGLGGRGNGEDQGAAAARRNWSCRPASGRRPAGGRAVPRSDPRRAEREGGALHDGPTAAAHRRREAEQEDRRGKLGPKLKEAEARTGEDDLAAELDAGPFVLAGCRTRREPMSIASSPRRPGWAGVADKGTQVAIDTTITEELKLEGLARDVIRQVQDTRKNAGLDLLDKIALHLAPGRPNWRRRSPRTATTIATAVQATEWCDARSTATPTPRP